MYAAAYFRVLLFSSSYIDSIVVHYQSQQPASQLLYSVERKDGWDKRAAELKFIAESLLRTPSHLLSDLARLALSRRLVVAVLFKLRHALLQCTKGRMIRHSTAKWLWLQRDEAGGWSAVTHD